MGDFYEICRAYEKQPEIVERDLFTLLRFPEVSIKSDDIIDNNYYMSLKVFLEQNGYIIREQREYKRAALGEVAKARGWVEIKIEDYNKLKNKNFRRDLLTTAAAIGSIIAAIVGIFSLFRQCCI